MATDAGTNPVDKVWLSTRIRVKQYRKMEDKRDLAGLAEFIHERFKERYITPLRAVAKGAENGFLMMASCCLCIEGLTAFREGWCSTNGLSERAFKLFLRDEDRFAIFRGHERDFWKCVRCGILHQGETIGGWRLNFSRPAEDLFVPHPPTVNCFKFLDALEETLADYRDTLTTTPWNHDMWRHFRRKMAATITDCEP
jgi:hypothetical protein